MNIQAVSELSYIINRRFSELDSWKKNNITEFKIQEQKANTSTTNRKKEGACCNNKIII